MIMSMEILTFVISKIFPCGGEHNALRLSQCALILNDYITFLN